VPRRNLTNARVALDALLPEINDHWAKRFEDQYAAAVAQAHTFADTYLDSTVAGLEDERRAVLQGLCELRDAFAALAADGAAGRLDARDYNDRFNELLRRQRELRRGEAEFTRVTELVERIEADPLAWVDDFQQRFPNTAPEFEF
jgi:hypothetical protein